uniref:Zinc finger PHD-type domain-containing protein n=1 Tax=Anopheles gambiae TaxID=7165 RepID=A0A1S4GAL9_ANOGA
MLGSPVEVRYDNGDSVVLIQADGGGPARSSTGGGATANQPNASRSPGEERLARNGESGGSVGGAGGSGGGGGGVGVGASGSPGSGESRHIIIHDRPRAAGGGGSITILTPTNNLKISINKKRRYPGRPHEYQSAKRALTHNLRHKLGELDKLLKACDNEDDDEDDDEDEDDVMQEGDVQVRAPAANGTGKRSPAAANTSPVVPPSPSPPPAFSLLARKDAVPLPSVKPCHPSTTAEKVEQACQIVSATSTSNGADSGDGSSDAREEESVEIDHLRPCEDVLVRISNNDQYYLGTVIEFEPKRSCLVRFEDQTTVRVELSRITRMAGNGVRNPHTANPRQPSPCPRSVDQAVQVDREERHDKAEQQRQENVEQVERTKREKQLEHVDQRPQEEFLEEYLEQEEPERPAANGKCSGERDQQEMLVDHVEEKEPEEECVSLTNEHAPNSLSAASQAPSAQPAPKFRSIVIPDEFSPLTSASQLPYSLHALHWDSEHRVNAERHYCYCGADGEWTREMIQCRRCEQWFHGRCVRSLQFPILLGDTFYLFICSICNHGHEFVRRFELGTVNLVHLALYNLIMRNGCRLYDLRLAIVPYIEDNLRALQLPSSALKLTTSERIDLLQLTLRYNTDRFLNGREVSQPANLWTLRKALPPPMKATTIPLGAEETVTEHLLRMLPPCMQVPCFLPRTNHEKNFFMDAATRERMLGLNYAERPTSFADPRINFADLIAPPAVLHASASPDVTDGKSTGTVASTAVAATGASQPLSTAGARVPDASLASNSSPTSGAVPFNATNGARLIGARKRKQRGIRFIAPVLLPMRDRLESLFPPRANFDGANNPFYRLEPPVPYGLGRIRGGRKGSVKRRTVDGHRQGPAMKRQLTSGEFLYKRAGAAPAAAASHLSRRASTGGQLQKIDENSVLSELSVQNVQRHNSAHSTSGPSSGSAVSGRRARSSHTYSTSSTSSEQVGAVGGGSGSVASDTSATEDHKPMASGRRSSGRLVALASKNYSDTKRHKRRRNSDTAILAGELNGSNGTAEEQNPGRTRAAGGGGSGGYHSSTSNSSCMVSGVYWDPTAVREPVQTRNRTSRPMFAVVGKRVLPNGKQELLWEEQ